MKEYPEKRQHPRFVCEGGVEVRSANSRPFWGTMSDISLGGCYVQTFQPLPAGSILQFLIKTEGVEIRGTAKVVAMHPGVGMALTFTELAAPDKTRLHHLIAQLTATDKHQGGGLMITP